MLQLLFGVSDLSLLEDLCDHYLARWRTTTSCTTPTSSIP